GKISAYDDKTTCDELGPAMSLPRRLRAGSRGDTTMRLPHSYLTLGIAAGAAALVLAGSIGAAFAQQSAEEFFRSRKEMSFITSSPPGGGYDAYSRLFARFMSKHLPGNPIIIVNNMPGGGGIRAANFLYNVAPKDGS